MGEYTQQTGTTLNFSLDSTSDEYTQVTGTTVDFELREAEQAVASKTSFTFSDNTATTELSIIKTEFSFSSNTATTQAFIDSPASKASFSFTDNTATTFQTATAQKTGFDFSPNTPTVSALFDDEVSAWIDGEKITAFKSYKTQERLNELNTFEFEAYITSDDTRTKVQEGKNILFYEGGDMFFKGRLENVEYTSDFTAKCSGFGQEVKLLNRKTARTEYVNTAGDSIINSIVTADTSLTIDTNEAAPEITLRFDHDNKAKAVAAVSNATGYDWYIEQKAADNYATDYFNFVERQGSSTSVYTFDIGDNARMVERDKDIEHIANDVTLLGRGDGINQLEARVFDATTHVTELDAKLAEGSTSTATLVDASQLGEAGDNVDVRIGSEVVSGVISDSSEDFTSKDVAGVTESSPSFDATLNESGIFSVVGFYSAGAGNIGVDIRDSGGTSLAFKSKDVSSGWVEFNFSGSDYSRIPDSETITIKFNGSIKTGTDSYSGTAFDVASQSTVPVDNDSSGGTVLGFTPENEINTINISARGQDDYDGNATEDIAHLEGVQVWLKENITQGIGPFSPTSSGAEAGSSIAENGVREEKNTDRTVVDKPTLEKQADNILKDRSDDIFRVQVSPTEPRTVQNVSLGDAVTVEDVTSMDVDDDFRVVGIDKKFGSRGEQTVLHCANRPLRLVERLEKFERDTDANSSHMQGATNIDSQNFGDNCDNTHPLKTEARIPEDAVAINKAEVAFSRESFRGYVEDEGHTHAPKVNFRSDSSKTYSGSVHDQWNGVSDTLQSDTDQVVILRGIVNIDSDGTGFNPGNYTWHVRFDTSGSSEGSSQTWHVDGDKITSNNEMEFYIPVGESIEFDAGGSIGVTGWGGQTVTFEVYPEGPSDADLNFTLDFQLWDMDSSESAGNPSYGIFEPGSESDVDVDVVVDGTTVTTVSNVSVGDTSTPVDVVSALSEPIAGEYHEVKLVPKNGSNNSRCRLNATVYTKTFVESKV